MSANPHDVVTIPADDPKRNLSVVQPDNLPHIGLVGDTYTVTIKGEDTDGRFCVIDMHIPPGGGPPPHRHDFDETFILLEGEMEATFRGKKTTVRAGQTLNIPANAPHQFHNNSTADVRMLCICAPARGRRSSSWKSACPWQRAPQLLRNLTSSRKRNLFKR